jgi:hypothetical protein
MKKEQLYKLRKAQCWSLVLVFGAIGLVCLVLLIYRLATEANPLLAVSLTGSLMFVSVFCFAVAMPFLANVSQLEQCYIKSRSYEDFQDCIGPFPAILWLDKLAFRLAPKRTPNAHGPDVNREGDHR